MIEAGAELICFFVKKNSEDKILVKDTAQTRIYRRLMQKYNLGMDKNYFVFSTLDAYIQTYLCKSQSHTL